MNKKKVLIAVLTYILIILLVAVLTYILIILLVAVYVGTVHLGLQITDTIHQWIGV